MLTPCLIYTLTSVWCQNDSNPVEWICWVSGHDAKKGNLHDAKFTPWNPLLQQCTLSLSNNVIHKQPEVSYPKNNNNVFSSWTAAEWHLTWQQTRKIKRVMAVHSTFSLNWICWRKTKLTLIEQSQNVFKKRQVHTFLSGFWISGITAQNGWTTSRNLTENSKHFMN